ncbi:hypothetical protein [Ornithinimicrobium pratense]|uniref:Uncharacterized protein n=1 Tax=Ornithinimicrobium pratense TaxID=2593973 RepID=A0A5J6V936_9MICO|nr:hypothetical protein [Ornithinimicrobium pratense]QFG69512.1 hypothetical protein FY030_13085 [Ornithinimicrobium pratense]
MPLRVSVGRRCAVERFSSDDVWPEHPKPHWRETLRYAQTHGWSLESGGHWGTIFCPTRECFKPIYATGTGGETVAKDTKKLVDRCPHYTGPPGVLAGAELKLNQAERLITAAEALYERDETDKAFELLAGADELLNDGEMDEATWDEAGRLIDARDALEAEAAAAFVEAAVEPIEAPLAVALADERVDDARRDLRTKHLPTDRVRELRDQANALRRRTDALRARIVT